MMLNLTSWKKSDLSDAEKSSVFYHNIFDYPMSFADLIRWKAGNKLRINNGELIITQKRGHYYLNGREGLIYKKVLRKRISDKKMVIALDATRLLQFIPSIKMIGVTGSLAMQNSNEESDIDLMIITSSGWLWTTRLISLICLIGQIRRFDDKKQKDKLCLNMWLDESDLIWKKYDRNVYTAHEIGQIVPLVNKHKTYEKFLYKNKWILDYWPFAVEKKYMVYSKSYIGKTKIQYTIYNILHTWLEAVAFKLQYNHMKSKITRETITKTRALFHPQDWGKVVLERLK